MEKRYPQPTAAWMDERKEPQEKRLVISLPSVSGEGEYLVAICYRPEEKHMLFKHVCPAIKNGKFCWHLARAVHCMKEWLWYLPFEPGTHKFTIFRRQVILRPEWKQIPVPGTPVTLDIDEAM